MEMYKKGQGFYTRFICFLLIALLSFFATYRLYYFGEVFGPFWEDADREYTAWADSIPILGEMINPGFLISALFWIVSLLVLAWAFFIYARSSEFLIETESELRKVSWPSREELISSSIVVVFTVIILSAYLGIVDVFLGKVFAFLL